MEHSDYHFNECAFLNDFRYSPFMSPIIQLVCPLKFCISFVFNFSWVLQWSREKLKTYLFFLGGGAGGVRVGETRFIMGDMQMPTPRRVKIFPLVNRNNCNKNNIIKAVRH